MTTTPKQEHRAKNQARGYDALREQMAELAKDSNVEAEAQTREIESCKSIRETLSPSEFEILIEFKHAGSPGVTSKGMAIITRYSERTVKAAVTRLRALDAINVTGFVTDRPRRNRIMREGVNILQARS